MNHLVIGNFKTGLETDREPFVINNDAFPVMNNAYVWRGRILKKKGTALLGRLQRNFTAASIRPAITSGPSNNWSFNMFGVRLNKTKAITNILNGPGSTITSGQHGLNVGQYVLITGVGGMIELNNNIYKVATIVDSGHFTIDVDSTIFGVYTAGGTWTLVPQPASPAPNQSLVPSPIGGTPLITITVVEGININTFQDQGNGTMLRTIDNDVSSTIDYQTGDISLNLTFSATANSLVAATFGYYPDLPVMGLEDFEPNKNTSPDTVNFPDLVAFDTQYSYQYNQTTRLFYDVTFYKTSHFPFQWNGQDFQQFWTTNYQGAMFATNSKSGFHFRKIVSIAKIDATHATIVVNGHGLFVGDYIYINEVQGASSSTINGQSGQVTSVTDANTITVSLPNANLGGTFTNDTGIIQFMTHSTATTLDKDGIRWYDGDPTSSSTLGWVNFAPPLSEFNATTNPNPQYLIGAKIIIPFKNRLIVFGPILATSAAPSGTYYPNRAVFSQVGLPYYSYPLPNGFTSDIVPQPKAWYQNVAGFGGFIDAPIPDQIITVQDNEDVLLCGLETRQMKFLFTQDDSLPFIFQSVNTELGSQSTFSGISLDVGAITIGDYGIQLTTQVSSQRIDLPILDQVFEIGTEEHGSERVSAVRDFKNEFIYFSYPPKDRALVSGVGNIFNSQTLLYNYRDNTWAIFDENYTTYGTYRNTQNYTWATLPFRTWSTWTNPWNFGGLGARYPNIIGGNQQGFVLIKDVGTIDSVSQYIQDIDFTDPDNPVITSPDHCLNEGDYIEISGVIQGATNPVLDINGMIFNIKEPITQNTFVLNLTDDQHNFTSSMVYIGGGVYRRISNFLVRTKQFPIFWDAGRGSRVGAQRYLFDNSVNGQITANIYTSMSDINSNDPLICGYMVFSNVVLTGPEPNQLFQIDQNQIWHRSSNSFVGNTVQVGFTLSDAQMRDNAINSAPITIQAIVLDLYPGPIIA